MTTATLKLVERRRTRCEVRGRDGAAGRLIFGTAARFHVISLPLGPSGFRERVAPNAFNQARGNGWPGLGGAGVLARWNHDDAWLLGNSRSGTLRLEIKPDGLWYEVDAPDTTAGRDVYTLISRGDVRASSFAFFATDDDWEMLDDGSALRTVTGAQVIDVAPVNTAAYPQTEAGVRHLPSIPELQRLGLLGAYASLARHAKIDLHEVLEARGATELGELARRGRPRRLSGREARRRLERGRRLTGAQAKLLTLERPS